MQIIKSAQEMQLWSRQNSLAGKTIGFAPTMGALHAGHKSLFAQARKENEVVVASIYVNPTQFGPKEDFARYPRTFEADIKLCEEAGVDCVFAPDTLYTPTAQTWVEVTKLQNTLEGISRPGHFKGVTTVVAKLFNIVKPVKAYFGRKDAQQLVIIKKMVQDLNFDLCIVPCATVRESDGLAMSSRNRYLSPQQRQQALCIYRSIICARNLVEKGEREAEKVVKAMSKILAEDPAVAIEYVAVVDANELTPLKKLAGDVLVDIAIKLGSVRLIDNISFSL